MNRKHKIEMPVVDAAKCNGCGLCVTACKCGAIVMKKGIATIIETEDCGWCLNCEIVCPTGAIVCPYEIVVEEG